MAKIGFIGLGNMGLPMAGNLVKQGHEVSGFDIVADNVAKAGIRGVAAKGSTEEAAKDVDIVVTMLPAGKHVLDVYGSGVLKAAKPGTLFIDSSTIDVGSARGAHTQAAGAKMLAGVRASATIGVAAAKAA